jgi:ABC-type glycerol-3-phosphate transport system permease component
MVATSLKTRWDAFRIPPLWLFKPTLENYDAVVFGRGGWAYTPLASLLTHSVVISVAATLLVLIAGSAAAYSFARFRTRYGRHVAVWLLSTRIFPPAVVAIPIFLMMQSLGLVDTYVGIVLVYAAINMPFAVWMLQGFFKQVPVELEESALVDGAHRVGAFFRVTLPLAIPGLAATAVFVWIQCWNEFLFALLLTRSLKTAPVSVTEFVTLYGIQWGQLTAQAAVMALPPLLLVIAVQRYFVQGLTLGAVKG